MNTKETLISVAHRMFAEHGYDGVSIADIASEVGITKQALLHHFGSKEKLYGRVLEGLSVRLETILDFQLTEETPEKDQFRSVLRELYEFMMADKHDARLIMRELLENKPRIENKQAWYLRTFLDRLTDLIQQSPEARSLKPIEAFARTYQIVGAINYFAISDPTLKKMYGEEAYRKVEQVFLDQLEQLFQLD